MENSFEGYKFQIKTILLFDPDLKPPMKKPSEEDIQDAKLLYYFPCNAALLEKRNHVGLAQGGYDFWQQTINRDCSGVNLKKLKKTQSESKEEMDFLKPNEEINDHLAKIQNKTQAKADENDKKNNLKKSKMSEILVDMNDIQQIKKTQDDQISDLLGLDKQDSDQMQFDNQSTKQDYLTSFQQDLLDINFTQPIQIEQTEVKLQEFEEFKQEIIEKKQEETVQNLITKSQIIIKLQDLSKNYQVIYLNKYIHILKEIEDSLWIQIVIQKKSQKQIIYTRNSKKELQAEQVDSDVYIYQQFSEESLLQFCNDFVTSFSIFFGNFRNHFTNKQAKEEFQAIFEDFVPKYQLLNSSDNYINILRYSMQGFNYAPIDKHNFLTIQYLLNILQTIDKNIQHSLVFYSGYFIYSTIKHEEALNLYNYFFAGMNPLESDDKKIANKFTKIDQIEKQNFYGRFFNLLSQTKIIMSQQKDLELSKLKLSNFSQDLIQPLQVVWMNGTRYQMNTIYEKKLMIIILYEENVKVSLKLSHEINLAIIKNSEKITTKLDTSIEKIYQKEESFSFIYYNGMNFASKISNSIHLIQLISDQLELVQKIYQDLKFKNSKQMVIKESNSWFYGISSLDRVLIVLFPSTYTLPKVYEDIEKLKKTQLSTFYIL